MSSDVFRLKKLKDQGGEGKIEASFPSHSLWHQEGRRSQVTKYAHTEGIVSDKKPRMSETAERRFAKEVVRPNVLINSHRLKHPPQERVGRLRHSCYA